MLRKIIKYGGMIFEKEEKEAIRRVLKRNWWGLDIEGKEFEKELAEYLGVRNAIFVNSGSSALLLIFQALSKIAGERNEIIVPATCFPTAISSIILAKFKPIIVDVELNTFLIDPEKVREKINPKTFGILAVHTAGNICNLDALIKICQWNKLVLIEDNCDGLGGNWAGKKVGSFGISATSFHAAHIISTGQGGAVFTNDDFLAEIIKSMRDWGRMVGFDDEKEGIPPLPEDYMQRYTYTEQGFNLNPIELQAAIGREQLKKIERFKIARKIAFDFLKEELTKLGFIVVENYPLADPCWFTIPFLVPEGIERKIIFEKLKKANIEFRNILASNIALQPAYSYLTNETFPNADVIAKRGLWISVHPSLKKQDLIYIINSLK